LPKVNVEHFVTAFALATIPSRYALERGRWADAAKLELFGKEFPWGRFPQSEAQLVFARGLGAARGGDVTSARRDVERLGALRDTLAASKVGYWAEQVDIQRQVASAWVARAEGRTEEALALLRAAADREDATEKHPVTPGPIAPARELLAEMLLEANEPAQALREFEASMRVEPNRFRGLYGAARAADLSGDRTKARTYYSTLLSLGEKGDTERPELRQVLLDFSLTERNLFNNYKVLKLDPAGADALIISHGHADHYGALPDYARLVQGRAKPGLTLYAGGEDTFCHRVAATPAGTI